MRINGVKYMWVREMKNETYQAKIADAEGGVTSHPVTIDSVHLLQKGTKNVMVGVKGGYVFAALADKSNLAQSAPSVIAALGGCVGWVCLVASSVIGRQFSWGSGKLYAPHITHRFSVRLRTLQRWAFIGRWAPTHKGCCVEQSSILSGRDWITRTSRPERPDLRFAYAEKCT